MGSFSLVCSLVFASFSLLCTLSVAVTWGSGIYRKNRDSKDYGAEYRAKVSTFTASDYGCSRSLLLAAVVRVGYAIN